MPINEADRGEFEAFRDLGRDAAGREILVGLSFKETEWYLDVLERHRADPHLVSDKELDRKAALDDRHAAVVLKILHAEFEAQDELRRRLGTWALTADKTARKPARTRAAVPVKTPTARL